jgi:hypothetical protein
MKNKLIVMAAVAGIAMATVNLISAPAAAAVPEATEVASPVGRLVTIQIIAWPLSTGTVGNVSGTLIAMPAGWLVVKDGTFEHWVPAEKVAQMKVSR